MSSFINWPTIYGSAYFLPGILVVVLLLALLLLLSSRRRSAAERAHLAPDPLVKAEGPAPESSELGAPALAPAEPVPAHVPGIVTQPVAMMTQMAGAAGQPVAMVAQPAAAMRQSVTMAGQPGVAPALSLVPPPVGPEPVAVSPLSVAPALAPIEAIPMQPEPVRRSGRRSKLTSLPAPGARAAATGGNDPMNAAIQDILNGWGDLAPEDTKRLELFRPDRLSAALAIVQLPKSSSTETKMRLSELRHYAGNLEQRAYAAQAAAAATAAAATAPEAAPVPAAAAPADIPVQQTPHIFAGYAATAPSIASVAPAVAPAMPALATAAFTGLDEPAAPAADAPLGAAKKVTPLDDPSSFWAQPRPVWEPDPGESFEETIAPTYHEIEMDPLATHDLVYGTPAGKGSSNGNGSGNGDSGNGYRSGRLMDMAPSATVDTPVSTPTVRETPAPPLMQAQPVAKPSYAAADDFFWNDEPDQAMSRLSVKVETAEQLLALPAGERVDMASFLPPAELVAAFRATRDVDLKKAVIDTLEHIGSPASLNALGNCFEDADSDIQTYALAAADRLLGVV